MKNGLSRVRLPYATHLRPVGEKIRVQIDIVQGHATGIGSPLMVNEILIVPYGRSYDVVEHDRVQNEFTETVRVFGVVGQNAQIEITVLIESIRMASGHGSMSVRAKEKKNDSTAKQTIETEKSRRRKKRQGSFDLATIRTLW